jgi:hypothetical protein
MITDTEIAEQDKVQNFNIAFVNSERWLAKSRVDITQCQHGNVGKFLSLYFFVLHYKTNIKLFSVLIYSYINTRGNWENSKLFENTPPFGRRVSTQFLVFPISTRIDITVYQHGKCFIFLKSHSQMCRDTCSNYLLSLVSIWS